MPDSITNEDELDWFGPEVWWSYGSSLMSPLAAPLSTPLPLSMWVGRLSRGPKKAPCWSAIPWCSLCLGCPLVGSGSWVLGYSILVAKVDLSFFCQKSWENITRVHVESTLWIVGIIRIHDMYIVQQLQRRNIKSNKPHSSSGRCGKWQWDRNFGRGKSLLQFFNANHLMLLKQTKKTFSWPNPPN